MRIEEQERVLKNDKKNMLVSASAGSGKTYIMIKYITQLICESKIPINQLLVLTFTKAAATEMKERLQTRLREQGQSDFIIEQIDSLSTANISTIHAYCEKMLKKYANLLQINENFQIADENISNQLRQKAFDKAFQKYYDCKNRECLELIACFKNNKSRIKEVLFEIEILLNSIADKERFLEKNINNAEQLFDNATLYLFENTKRCIGEQLKEVEALHINDFQYNLEQLLMPVNNSSDIYKMTEVFNDFSFPDLPKKKEVGDDVVERLKEIKASINKLKQKVIDLNLLNKDNVEYQKQGLLEKNILSLYKIYEEEENQLKRIQNLVDFYDLEKYMDILSQKEDIFAGLKYVFVDEYQDTNKIQEKIVKNIAKNCNFVAVGDVKQGIYGFRLASSEIFLKDMQEFEVAENSSVNFLKSNFRSDQRVLDFVNDVFKVCMTENTSGVNYLESSMLDGKKEFLDDGYKAVTIDLLPVVEKEKEVLPETYSVKTAQRVVKNDDLDMLTDILRRIVEVMSSQIYDGEKFRQCVYSDIAILSRKRDGLFGRLENFLTQCGVPVVSSSRSNLQDEPEIKVLINLLKVALNFGDDIACLSVLLSDFCDASIQEILDEKNAKSCSVCELLKISENLKISKFNQNLEKFRENFVIFGAKYAFLDIFRKTNYRAKINKRKTHIKLNTFIDKFLSEIVSRGFEHDLPGLIDYFETVNINVSSDASAVEEAVLLTTIHNSKGLEYPIVFLIGCDQSLSKGRPKIDVEINEKFGLALKYYDQKNNNEIVSAKMRAIKEFDKRKEFVEELMIFYVALTRAKNRLYLFGYKPDKNKLSLRECDSYFDLIFYATNLQCDDFETPDLKIENVLHLQPVNSNNSEKLEPACANSAIIEKIFNYINYNYKYTDLKNFKLKESVTNLSRKDCEDELSKFSNDHFSFGGDFVEMGNAYHLALKVIDFEKVFDENSLSAQIKANQEVLKDALPLLDKNLLLQNVLTLKQFSKNAKVFKEKEFILKENLSTLIDDCEHKDKILVQGIIDFFAIKENGAVLIDYKYSNSKNDEYLINKYKNQLKLYKIAIKNALNIEINEIYLFSIKYNRLIKANI